CLALMMASYVSLIAIISPQKNMLFSKLWLSSRKNRLPLAALNTIRMVIGVAFIFTSIEHFFRIPQAVSVLIGIVVVAVIARSNYMSSAAINMELRFISNFSDKTLAAHKEKRKLDHDHKWLVDNIYICKIRLTGELKSQTLQQVIGTSMVHVLVIKIIRDGRHINIPNNHTKLMKGDILHVMGTKNGISALRYVIRETVEIEETESEIITVAEYRRRQEADRIKPENRLIMVPLPVKRDSDFSRKSIRNSGIRHNYHGFVIGIERGNLPIVNPNIDLLLEPGDIIWLAGGQQMAVSLLSEGLLDEEKLLQKFKEFKDGKH
ncbi:MAG: TrkA C-terminal domain-containing protein, partial [Anaerovoracaceae bacterium]